MIIYKPTKFQVHNHQRAGLVSKRDPKMQKLRIGILTPAGAAEAAFAISLFQEIVQAAPAGNRDCSSCRKSHTQLCRKILNAAPAGNCECSSRGNGGCRSRGKSRMRYMQEIANAVHAGNRECGSCGKSRMRLLWETEKCKS